MLLSAVGMGFVKVSIPLKWIVYLLWENDCAYKGIYFG